MSRVGIITYHFAVNYGAMLQCYALKTAVEKLGNHCEVLNYISDVQLNNNSLYRRGGAKNYVKNLLLLPFHGVRAERQRRVEAFRKECLGTGKRMSSISELDDHIRGEKLDVLISGSDQVWNPHIEDFDKAFFYPFSSPARKIGYAVSIGKASEEDLLPYREWIRDFDEITVREESAKELVSALAGKPVQSAVDPVFLLSSEEWEAMLPSAMKQNSGTLAAYFVKPDQLDEKIRIVEKIAAEKGLKPIIISPRISKYNFTKHVISNAGPLEFLTAIRDAEFVCTDSFHGTVFSAILNRQFLTLEREEDKKDGRKKDVLKILKLSDRIQYINHPYDTRGEIDYVQVNLQLEEIRKEAMHALKGLLLP